MDLKTRVADANLSLKKYSRRLEKLKIKTLEDFLYHIPFRYEDYSLVSKISQVQTGEIVTIRGQVLEIKNQYTRRWKTLQKAKVSDETGSLEVTWFNQPFLAKTIQKGDFISLSGEVISYKGKLGMQSPNYELLKLTRNQPTIHTGRLVPVYPETKGVTSKWLRRRIYQLLSENKFPEYLPPSIIADNNLMGFSQVLSQIHFPDNLAKAAAAKLRLSFDELFLLNLSVLARRREWSKNFKSLKFSVAKFKDKIEKFWHKLPFTLTPAQDKAVSEIFEDLEGKSPMNRLLEGDVGSGKTVVAGVAMYSAYLNGFQSVLMAPTEILAQQHHRTIYSLLSTLGVSVGLVTGNKKEGIKNQESRINKKTKENHNSQFVIRDSKPSFDVLVGTHAVLSKKIDFKNLGLVVIDEQQRFGVEQRTLIRKKGKNPHFLTMTATPIPRTIALTLYGDLDLSILDEMPTGRKKIKTWLVPPEKRQGAYQWINSQLSRLPKPGTGGQLFVVCPFIEESETMATVKAAIDEYEYLKKSVFPNLKLGLLHGRLKTKEKDEVLNRFRAGKIDVLVATPVVEVGIDIPNATIILIEGAERFGLSQLHQLRGRVGRGDKQSYCLLFTESKREPTLSRLKALETINTGSKLAELDLKLRGHGELYGTLQHGRKYLKIADFSNPTLIKKTKEEAIKIFPKLKNYSLLWEKIKNLNNQQVSPD